MKLFEKFKENNRKYYRIFGLKICYGKVKRHKLWQLDYMQKVFPNYMQKVFPNYMQKVFPYLYIYMAAQVEHQKVFPKYRNCHRGKEMVLLASGPTLDDYTAQKDVLFMGVNKSFMSGKADLDYLFVQDLIPDAQDKIDEYIGNNCKKFYGMHYLVPGIAQSHADKAGAERYYFTDMNKLSPWPFPVDCSVMPFNTFSSVVFPAAVFALWTGVKKLYIVGCDTNLNGYFGNVSKNTLFIDNVIYGWQKFKEFAATWYPETEIISVNPIGLKGLFHDVYTESFLAKHPDIAATKPEILK